MPGHIRTTNVAGRDCRLQRERCAKLTAGHRRTACRYLQWASCRQSTKPPCQQGWQTGQQWRHCMMNSGWAKSLFCTECSFAMPCWMTMRPSMDVPKRAFVKPKGLPLLQVVVKDAVQTDSTYSVAAVYNPQPAHGPPLEQKHLTATNSSQPVQDDPAAQQQTNSWVAQQTSTQTTITQTCLPNG